MSGDREYHVAFVPEEQLPPHRPWVFIEYDGETWLAIKRSEVTPKRLEEVWETFRQMIGA
jgi:hypothetical protein